MGTDACKKREGSFNPTTVRGGAVIHPWQQHLYGVGAPHTS